LRQEEAEAAEAMTIVLRSFPAVVHLEAEDPCCPKALPQEVDFPRVRSQETGWDLQKSDRLQQGEES
jgi:hypothetical protein